MKVTKCTTLCLALVYVTVCGVEEKAIAAIEVEEGSWMMIFLIDNWTNSEHEGK